MKRNRTIWMVLMLACSTGFGCADDDDGQPTGGDADGHSHTVTASEVLASPQSPIESTQVQAWLESLLSLVQSQAAEQGALATTVTEHGDRLAVLESGTGNGTPVTAAKVAFDDKGTAVKGASVQDFGEAMDGEIGSLSTSLAQVQKEQGSLSNQLQAIDELWAQLEPKIAKLQQDLLDQRFSENIFVEDKTKPDWEKDPAVPLKYYDDSSWDDRVRGAIQLTWKYLDPLVELAADPCPEEMALVGEEFCVDKKRHPKNTVTWQGAALFCNDAKKRLCTPAEFMIFCTYPSQYLDPTEYKGPVGDTQLMVPEWMDQVAMNGATLLAFRGSGLDCSGMGAVAADSINYFRCCKTANPTTAK